MINVVTNLQEAFKDNFSLFTNGHDCWVKSLHTILKDINMVYVFERPKNCKPKDILMIKHRLQQQFRNKWNSELNQSEKLRSYKCRFQFEHYLKHIHIPNLRQSLTRLRISCHRLFIETGRCYIPKIPAEVL